MTNEHTINQRLMAVENALAQQRLEELEVPPEVAEEMKRAAKGEIDIEEGICTTVDKFTPATIDSIFVNQAPKD